MDPGELSAAMREAIEAQIVVTDGEGRFAFRHALLREVLYDDLLPGERAELHLALARALERMRGGHDEAWIATGDRAPLQRRRRPARRAEGRDAAAEAVSRLQAYHEAAALLDRARRALAASRRSRGAHRHSTTARCSRACARAHYLWGDDDVAVGALRAGDRRDRPGRRSRAGGDGDLPARHL